MEVGKLGQSNRYEVGGSHGSSIRISLLQREAEHFFFFLATQSYLYFLSVTSAHCFSCFSIRRLVSLLLISTWSSWKMEVFAFLSVAWSHRPSPLVFRLSCLGVLRFRGKGIIYFYRNRLDVHLPAELLILGQGCAFEFRFSAWRSRSAAFLDWTHHPKASSLIPGSGFDFFSEKQEFKTCQKPPECSIFLSLSWLSFPALIVSLPTSYIHRERETEIEIYG